MPIQKYKDINFIPPQQVARQAEKGLLLRKQFHKGGTMIGVARARDLKNQVCLTPSTILRMVSYFARHEVDKKATNFGNEEQPSPGYIAWLLWGGDAGKTWAEEIKKQMSQT